MRDRTFVCTCEDVERAEIEHAIELGYRDIESLKRVTGATTGPCQGKWCLAATIEVLADATGLAPERLGSITHRPPVQPVPLGVLAQCPASMHDPDASPAKDAHDTDETDQTDQTDQTDKTNEADRTDERDGGPETPDRPERQQTGADGERPHGQRVEQATELPRSTDGATEDREVRSP